MTFEKLPLSIVTCVYGKSGRCPALRLPHSIYGDVVGAAVPQAARRVLLSLCAHAVHPAVGLVTDCHPVEVKMADSDVPSQCDR